MENPLLLLVVGMGTTFVVLLLVIAVGDLLIWFVNKFIPAAVKPVAEKAQAIVDKDVAQAIQKAIQTLTGGKSTASKIEKL